MVPADAAVLPSLCKKQASCSPQLGGTTGQGRLCSRGKPMLGVGRDGKQDRVTLFLASNSHYVYYTGTRQLPDPEVSRRALPGSVTLTKGHCGFDNTFAETQVWPLTKNDSYPLFSTFFLSSLSTHVPRLQNHDPPSPCSPFFFCLSRKISPIL